MRWRLILPILLLAMIALSAAAVTAAPTCTITFDGNGTGATAWGTAANWDTNVLPAATDHVCVPAGQTAILNTGTATVQTVQAAGQLTISGGRLALTDTGNESAAAAFTMTSGGIAGAGSLALTGTASFSGGDIQGTGTLRVAPGATMTVANGSPYHYAERPIEIDGLLEFATAHGLNTWNGTGAIHVAPGGGIRGSAPSGVAYVGSAIDNDGTVDATSAVLSLRGGSGPGTSGGAFGGGAGFVDLDSGAQTLGEGALLLGGVRVSGGALAVAAGATARATGANEMSTGDLRGPGTFAVQGGSFTVSGGDIMSAARVVVAQPATMTVRDGSPYLYADSRMDVAGVLSLATAHGINDWNGTGVIHVAPAGVIRGAAPTGVAYLAPSIQNDGSVEAASGILSLRGGSGAGTSSGDFGGGAGFVDFDAKTQRLADGARLLARSRVSGGTVAVADGATAHGVGPVEMSTGNLGGPGAFRLGSGTLTVTGGDFSGDVQLTVALGATLAVAGGSPYLHFGSHIEVAGVLALLTAHGINSWNGTPTIRITPGGLLRGSAAAGGIAYLAAAVENDGLVDAASGILSLRGGSAATTSAGTFGGGAGFVDLDSGTQTLTDGAKLTGNVRVSGGTLAVDGGRATVTGANEMSTGTIGGGGAFELSSGTFSVSGGTMSGAGVTVVAAGATLRLTQNMALATGRTLRVGGLVDIAGDRGITRSTTPEPLVHVLDGGVLRKTAGSLAGFVDPELRNDGLVDSSSGRLDLRRGAAVGHTGDFDGDSATAHTSFSHFTHVLAAGTRLLGHTEIGGGTIRIPAGVTVPVPDHARQTGGSIGGPGKLEVTGDMTWTGGTQEQAGTTRVAPGATLVVDACSVTLRDGRTLDVDGTLKLVRQSDLFTTGAPAAVIDVAGRIEFDDTQTGTCGTLNGISGNAIVRNTGTVERLAGAGASRLTAVLDNDGVVSASAGSLELGSDETVTHAGAFGADGAAGTVEFSDGDFILEPGAGVAGNAAIGDATVRLPEDMTLTVGPGRTFTQDGGALSGGGELRVLGTLNWNDGTQSEGTTVIEPGATATLGGLATAYLSLRENRVLVNRGAISLSGGELSMDDGTSILNQGTLDVTDDSMLYGSGSFAYGGALIHNTGVLRKAAGTGTAQVWPAIDNDGTVEVAGGTLSLLGRLLNASQHDSSLTGGTWIARNATLGVFQEIDYNAARVVLDGDQSRVMTLGFDGSLQADALAGLRGNAGAGRLELQGGRDLAVAGAFRNGGTVRVGAGSTMTVAGAYDQSSGLTSLQAATARLTAMGAQVALTGGRLAGVGSVGPVVNMQGGVLEPGIAGAGTLSLDALTLGSAATTRVRVSAAGLGSLQVAGAAALAGTLEVVKDPAYSPAAGTELLLAAYGSRSGTFAAVTGDAPAAGLTWQVDAGATQLKLRAIAPPASRVADAPTTAPGDAPPVSGAAVVPEPARIDDTQMIARGAWKRRAGLAVATRRGATLVRPGVTGRQLSIAVATCRSCGRIQVFWGGRLVTEVSLRSNRPGRRVIRVADYRRARTGSVRLRATSARRVAVDAIIVG